MASASAFAQTETVTFTYSGTGLGSSETDAGSGSFSYSGSLSSVGLGDLTNFTYTDTYHEDLTYTVYNFGKTDLTAFSATIDPSTGDVTALSLATDFLSPTPYSYPGQTSFTVDSLGMAYFFNYWNEGSYGTITTNGPVLSSSVPEGGTDWLYLLLAGGGVVLVFMSRIASDSRTP
jgi:hypothetical protein